MNPPDEPSKETNITITIPKTTFFAREQIEIIDHAPNSSPKPLNRKQRRDALRKKNH